MFFGSSEGRARPIGLRRSVGVGALAASLVAGTTLLGLGAPTAQAAPPSPAPSAVTSGNVIVVLRNQNTNVKTSRSASSPRVRANLNSQRPVIDTAKAAGATHLVSLTAINAFAAKVTSSQASTLAADPAVAAVVPDLPITRGSSAALEQAAKSAAAATPKVRAGTCPADPTKPLLEPEALQVTHTAYQDTTKAQAQNIVTGTGVKVAFLADGVDPNNGDFIRANGSHVFVDYQDFSDEGPNAPSSAEEAFGDASAIAAQGRKTYDLTNYANAAHPIPAGCTIQVRGVAPGASLIGLKVFGNAPTAPTSRFIQAIGYAVAHGADVINESFGGNPYPDNGDDPITLADNAAIAAGVTVVASSGDAGTTGTIGSPASSPAGVIGVAATTTFRSYAQTTESGFQFSNGTWIDNNISGLSSGGVTQAGGVPSLAAPGDLGWAVCTPNPAIYLDCANSKGTPSSVVEFGGTSQSSPLTSGAAALVIEAYKNTHGGVRPTPALVKRLLTSTATDLGHPAYEQGAGLLNTLAAVKAAESWRDADGKPAATGSALVVDKSQLRISGNPGATKTARLKVTNTGRSVQFVQASTRSFEDTVNTATGTDPLNTATAPSYVDSFGISRSYVKQQFTVGKADRLDVSIAAPASANNAAIRIILIDPSGAYAAYSIPQGLSNYGHVDVRYPKAGTWTAYFALSKATGFNGTVAWSAVQTDFTTHGTVSPRYQVIKPGQTKSFTVHSKLPVSPSDLSASVQLKSSNGHITSVPMTLRAVIPARDTTFVGTITGGNGRQALPGQSNIYRLNVPAGKRDLSIGVKFSDPNQADYGFLTAPNGEIYSFQSNSGGTALQIFRRNPTAGQWTFTLVAANPVSGLELSQPFVGQVSYNTVAISAPALPNNTSVKLKAGVSVVVPVKVKNTGLAPITYYVDPRLTAKGVLPLTELSGNATTPLPVPAGVNPQWLVPTQSSVATFTATADQPVNLDVLFQTGEPERYGAAAGNGATVSDRANEVSPGIWFADIGQSGPFTGPAKPGTVTASAVAYGRLFDPAVTSPGGDPWQLGVAGQTTTTAAQVASLPGRIGKSGARLDRSALSTASQSSAASAAVVAPLTLRPGQSGTINVTITPTGKPGTKVKGGLFVDSFDATLFSGDEIKALPYAYTIN